MLSKLNTVLCLSDLKLQLREMARRRCGDRQEEQKDKKKKLMQIT